MITEETIKTVLENGATRAKKISPDLIVVDRRVHMKCKIPQCPDYGVCPACPPANLPSQEVKEIIKLYESAVLIQVDTNLKEEKDFYSGANKLHNIILEGEKKAFTLGARFATGFIGGSCHLCDACRSGEKCQNAIKVRPSMEAMSIDVFATAENANMPITFPVIDVVIWTGLILLT